MNTTDRAIAATGRVDSSPMRRLRTRVAPYAWLAKWDVRGHLLIVPIAASALTASQLSRGWASATEATRSTIRVDLRDDRHESRCSPASCAPVRRSGLPALLACSASPACLRRTCSARLVLHGSYRRAWRLRCSR